MTWMGMAMAVKKRVLIYIAPVDLMYSWPDVASQAGFSVRVNPDPYVISLPGLPEEQSITCRSGTVCRGNISIQILPSAGAVAVPPRVKESRGRRRS
jgi:hypothetical protein